MMLTAKEKWKSLDLNESFKTRSLVGVKTKLTRNLQTN